MPAPSRRSALPGLAVAVAVVVVLNSCGNAGKRGEANAPSAGAGASAATTTTGPGPKPTSTKAPVVNRWDKAVVGAPAAFAASPKALDAPDPNRPAPDGVSVWNDLTGWHVRVVRDPALPPVAVRVEANDQPMSTVRVERIIGATEPVPPEAVTVTVMLPAAAATGMDLSTGFYTNSLTFSFASAYASVPAEQIHLGAARTPAAANPVHLTLSRTPH